MNSMFMACALFACLAVTHAAQAQAIHEGKILFVAKPSLAASNGTAMYVLDVPGAKPVKLSGGTAQAMNPAWSPDGKRIAFTVMPSSVPGLLPALDIHIMNADGSRHHTLTHNTRMLVFAPAWSQDGKQLAYSSWETVPGQGPSPHIYTMDADGTHARRLGAGMIPTWSPSGREILYTRVGAGRNASLSLCTMHADGTGSRVLAHDAALGAWSPDGRRIAYVGAGSGGQFDLFVMNMDGSGKTQLTHTPELEVGVQWSQDGRRLVFNRLTLPPTAGTGGPVICSMSAGGGAATPLTGNRTFDFMGNGLSFLLYPVFVRSYYRAVGSAP